MKQAPVFKANKMLKPNIRKCSVYAKWHIIQHFNIHLPREHF